MAFEWTWINWWNARNASKAQRKGVNIFKSKGVICDEEKRIMSRCAQYGGSIHDSFVEDPVIIKIVGY